MKWNGIILKLGGTIMVLFLVVVLPLGYAMDQIFTGFYYSRVEERVDALSEKYASAIQTVTNQEILNMFELLADLTDTELYIVDSSGKVVANSGLSEFLEGSVINENDLNYLLNRQQIKAEYVDPVTKEHFLISGEPIMKSTEVIGGLFVLASIDEIHESIKKVRTWLVISVIGSLFIALGVTYIITKKLSSPLLQMEKATREIAKGELATRVSFTSNDEVGSLAAAINDLAIELEEYRSNRREFFANISHELRTPIAYLQGYSRVLKEGLYESEDEKVQYLAIIDEEGNRLTALINDLFDLSKMEERKIDLNLELVDIEEIIEMIVQKTKLRAKEKHLALKVELNEHLPMILTDGMRMEQIILNLIENSIRYSEQGSITINAWNNKSDLFITIKDTGVGIPEKDLAFIFDRFYRVEKSRSREYGGTGLGLAIVKQLVELLKGTVRIESKIGEGTEVKLSFPIDVDEEPET